MLAALLCAGGGCASHPSNQSSGQGSGLTWEAYTKLSRDQCRAQLFSIADAYMNIMNQGYDQLLMSSSSPEVIDWANRTKISSATTILGDASEANEAIGLIDLAIFSAMQRQAVEEHWIPTLLGDQGQPLLHTLRTGETQVWSAEAHVFSADQLQQLRDIIAKWTKAHSSRYFVGHIGISEVAAESQVNPAVLSPRSLYGLLYLEQFNVLNPVAEQLQAYRAVTERAMFLLPRLTQVMGWEASYAATRITTTSEARSFAASAKRISEALAEYPKDLARERSQAVEQLATVLASERKATIEQLDAKVSRIGGLIAQANDVIVAANKTSVDANTAAQNTILLANQFAQRLATLIFAYALILTAAIAAAVCLVAWFRRRPTQVP